MEVACFSCTQNAESVSKLPPREVIYDNGLWRVSHAFGSSLLGWLVVIPRRHILSFSELTPPEAASLGTLLADLSRVLEEGLGGAQGVRSVLGGEGGVLPPARACGPAVPGYTSRTTRPGSVLLHEPAVRPMGEPRGHGQAGAETTSDVALTCAFGHRRRSRPGQISGRATLFASPVVCSSTSFVVFHFRRPRKHQVFFFHLQSRGNLV